MGADERRPDDLTGMDPAAAREYIAQYTVTLKMREKDAARAGEEEQLWESRAQLARSKGAEALAQQADKQADMARTQRAEATLEIDSLKAQIESMKRQLPGLTARVRSVDPDVLEQNLLMATGYLPGDEEKAATDRDFKALEKDASADAALAALKAKMQPPSS